MSFKGTIDFQQPLTFNDDEVQVYGAYESPDVYVLPDAIGLALTNTGKSDLTITLVKAQNSLSPVSLYGTLDIRLSLKHPTENALKALRKTGSTASVIAAACTGGYLQLQPVGNAARLPAELQSPEPADWNLVGPTQFLYRLDISSVSLMKEALKNGSLLFNARAVLECKGVAARLPLKVHFNSKEMLVSIQKLPGWKDGSIQADDLRVFFNQHPDLLPLTISGTASEQAGLFADAMTDRLLARFGKLTEPDNTDEKIFFSLLSLQEAGDGQFDWDLSETLQISRVLDLRLNPLEAAQQLANQQGGIESSLMEVMVPELQTGFKCVHLSANIPAYRPNVLKAGVQITSAPHAPVRMQAISESVNFNSPDDSSDVMLRFSPAEPGNYQFRPFMLVESINGVHNISGSETPSNKDLVLIKRDDFAVNFLTVEASPDVLEIATLSVAFINTNGIQNKAYEINKSHPLLSFCLAQTDALPESMQISAKALATGAVISVPAQPAGSMRIGLYHFAGYGYHTINITCHFTGQKGVVIIELQPETTVADTQLPICFFTPENNTKDWGYYADSPFSCQYRYRKKNEEGSTGDWSAMQSPFAPLLIDDTLPDAKK